MDAETQILVVAGVFAAAFLAVAIFAIVLCLQVRSLRKKVTEMQNTGRMRVQKLKLDPNDKNHAFHNPGLAPDEELTRRGYSMYQTNEDVESGRNERQTDRQFVNQDRQFANQDRQFVNPDRQTPSSIYEERLQSTPHFVEELTREIDSRQQRPPSFLMQSIQNNKTKTRSLANPVANGRQSETNPNFIY